MNDGFSTLIFDLDGTLSDPSLGITKSINYALETHGYPWVEATRVAREIGPPLDETFRKFIPDNSDNVVLSLIAKYRERYAEIGYSENEVYPKIPQLIAKLSTSGVTLGVCTSKRKDFAEKILALFGIRENFSFISGGDVGIEKRDQLSGLMAREVIDRDAVMIGDRGIDVLSARYNNLRSIGVLWGFGSVQELATAEPTYTVRAVDELERRLISLCPTL